MRAAGDVGAACAGLACATGAAASALGAAAAPPRKSRALLGQDDLAFGLANFRERTIGGRNDLEHDLVRLNIDQEFVSLHRLANLLVPGRDRAVGDGLGELRRLDLDTHFFGPVCGSGIFGGQAQSVAHEPVLLSEV